MNVLTPHIAGRAGLHLARVIQKMIDGVAFRQDGKTFNVFSHEGDELGTLTTEDVGYAISFMKRHGIAVGKCHSYMPADGPAFSFAWSDWCVFL